MLRPDPTLITPPPPPVEEIEELEILEPARPYQIQLYIRDSASLGAALAQIRGIAGVEAVSERSVAIGAWSLLLVSYRGDSGSLRDQLMARGWTVEFIGGSLRITRAAAPAPPPAAPADSPQ
jgi:hypothetical protein